MASVKSNKNQSPDANDDSGFNTGNTNGIILSSSYLISNDTDDKHKKHADLSIIKVDSGAGGTATLSADHSTIQFQPESGYIGPAFFTYTLNDNHKGIDTATVRIDVTGNHAPVAVDDEIHTQAGQPITITRNDLLGNDSDLDGDYLFWDQIANPRNGTMDGFIFDEYNYFFSFVFTPDNGFTGEAGVDYGITDGKGNYGMTEDGLTDPFGHIVIHVDAPFT